MEFIFVHIGKTAGTSIIEGSEGLSLWSHDTASEIRETMGMDRFEAATTFTVIREPESRYLSACQHMELDPNSSDTWAKIEKACKGRRQRKRDRLFLQQWRMLETDGDVSIDHVFRFEKDVPGNVYEFLADNGLATGDSFPHCRKASKKLKLTAEARAWVHGFYRMDYERLGF